MRRASGATLVGWLYCGKKQRSLACSATNCYSMLSKVIYAYLFTVNTGKYCSIACYLADLR